MTYQELIQKARNGRSVHATALALGIPSTTFQRYAKGTRFPTAETTVRIADAAGVDLAEAVRAIAQAQEDSTKDS